LNCGNLASCLTIQEGNITLNDITFTTSSNIENGTLLEFQTDCH
jgi:hypothetical protein